MSIKFFGQFLLEKNLITPAALIEAVKYQESRNLKFGDYAVSKGFMTKKDINKILAEQRHTDMQFGELAVSLNILTRAQVNEILTLQKNDHILIGQALLEKELISPEILERELDLFRKDQSQFIPGEIEVPDEVENPVIIRDVVDLTQKMLLRIAHIFVKPDNGSVMTTEPARNDVAIVTHLSGDLSYDYVIATSLPVSVLITSGIMGQNASGEPREVIVDGVKEFCNIVCGNIIAKMAQRGKSVNISAPKEIPFSSKGYSIVKGRNALYFVLGSTAGNITLAIV